MDFTPGIFNFRNEALPNTHPQTTLAKQLALSVVLFSPLQMASDMIENYEHQSAFSFITSCPTTWAKTVVPASQIGEYVIVARKDRDSEDWFVGGITNEKARHYSLSFDFLDKDTDYKATIYADGSGVDYEKNPYPVTITEMNVNNQTIMEIQMARSGGVAIRIEKL